MIKDFTNPHGEITPDRTEVFSSGIQEFRILRKHGLFQLTKKKGRHFVPCEILNINGQFVPAIFQTIHEAEYAMKRIASSTVVNYYTIYPETSQADSPEQK